jgi:hypothetical protein
MRPAMTALVLSSVLSPLSVHAETPLALKSVNVDLPDPGEMFAGPGSEAINNNCLACHSSDMILNQPPMSRTAWQAIVQKMVRTYKAPVDENDVVAILDYLTSIKGKK